MIKPLTEIPTRQLLAWRDSCYGCGGAVAVDGDKPHYDEGGSLRNGYTLEEIKAELATREHIPNKKEAAALRRQNAWQAQGACPKVRRREGRRV